MLKPLVSKFGSDLSVRFSDIAQKQVPAKLKPIVGAPTALMQLHLGGGLRFHSRSMIFGLVSRIDKAISHHCWFYDVRYTYNV